MTGADWTKFLGGRRILVTGHTGFKGAWTSLWLHALGARVHGLALAPRPEQAALFNAIRPRELFASQSEADIRNLDDVRRTVDTIQPEAILHLAAQSLVRPSYADPAGTFAANVMGTVHILEAARLCRSVQSIVIVTSDKCYENREQIWPYREADHLGGHDPYSASKGAAEIVTASYARSFFSESGGAASASGRAGNVIGGGDFSPDRIVPDYIKAIVQKSPLVVRNPDAIRPWQHVLEPISGYLKLAALLPADRQRYSGGWNFGPHSGSNKTVRQLAQALGGYAKAIAPVIEFGSSAGLHEAKTLRLDISKAQANLGWSPLLAFDETIGWTMEWYLEHMKEPERAANVMRRQIDEYSERMLAGGTH